jgi:hypothetical protein
LRLLLVSGTCWDVMVDPKDTIKQVLHQIHANWPPGRETLIFRDRVF